MEQLTIRKTKEEKEEKEETQAKQEKQAKQSKQSKQAKKIAFFIALDHVIQSHPEFNREEYDNPCLPYERLRLILSEWKPFFRYTYARGKCNSLIMRFHRMYTSLSDLL